MLEAKLLAGRSGYDVVAPTGYFLERQIKAKIFQPLDKSKLPNLVHLWPEVSQRLAKYDPGNRHAVNYMWGTTGIGYNVAKAREVLGANAKIDSWDIVFKPENLATLQGLRHPHAGFRRRHHAGGAALSRPRPQFDPGGRPAEGQRSGDDDPARWCASFTRPNISMRSRPARSASRSGSRATSSRRRSARPRPRTASRSPIRYRTRARSSGSTISRSRATQGTWRKRTSSSISCRRPRSPPATRISSPTPTAISRARNSSTRKSWRIGRSIRMRRLTKKLYTVNAHDAQTVRLLNRMWTRIKTGQ